MRSLFIDWYITERESAVQLGECAISRPMRFGGPVGSPLAETGMIVSTPSLITAMRDPSGDHAGPAPTRESIEKWAPGVNQRSSPALSADIDRIRFVPSRKRDEYGTSAATTTRFPSRDQVGEPGPNIDA